MCGVERMEGVLIMAANTKALPRMDMSISGALRPQFMMVIVSRMKLSSLCEGWSVILKLKSDQMIFPSSSRLAEILIECGDANIPRKRLRGAITKTALH